MEELIKIKELTKVYGSDEYIVKALNNISMSIEKNKITSIIGKSGSGKTTLLNIIGGLDTNAKGQVLFEGKNILEMRDADLARYRGEKLGHVFQFFELLPELNAMENILLPAMIAGNKVDNEYLMGIVEKLELSERLKHYPEQLSGGQRQRVAIARALINNPEILICDEPTGALDKNTSMEIMNLLKILNQEGKTIIIVTHDLEIAKQCDRVIELVDGSIVK